MRVSEEQYHFPWNTDGRPGRVARLNRVSRIYSDGGNHTRVFVVSYAHGRILSVPSRLVIILGVRAVLPVVKVK